MYVILCLGSIGRVSMIFFNIMTKCFADRYTIFWIRYFLVLNFQWSIVLAVGKRIYVRYTVLKVKCIVLNAAEAFTKKFTRISSFLIMRWKCFDDEKVRIVVNLSLGILLYALARTVLKWFFTHDYVNSLVW